MADLLRRLEQEHRDAERLMDDLEEAEEPGEREKLLGRLEKMLATHMEVEEKVVYPVLAEIDADSAEEGRTEHDSARELLGKLRDGGVDQPGFGAVVSALKGAIGHHVEEEESEIFPKLRDEVGVDRFAEAAPSSGADDLGSLTKEELYGRAKDLDIEGRSQMSKDELAAAVRTAEGA